MKTFVLIYGDLRNKTKKKDEENWIPFAFDLNPYHFKINKASSSSSFSFFHSNKYNLIIKTTKIHRDAYFVLFFFFVVHFCFLASCICYVHLFKFEIRTKRIKIEKIDDLNTKNWNTILTVLNTIIKLLFLFFPLSPHTKNVYIRLFENRLSICGLEQQKTTKTR